MPVEVGLTDGVDVWVEVGELVMEAVDAGVAALEGVAVSDGVRVPVGLGDADRLIVVLGVCEGVPVPVPVGVPVDAPVPAAVSLGVCVLVGVGVAERVSVLAPEIVCVGVWVDENDFDAVTLVLGVELGVGKAVSVAVTVGDEVVLAVPVSVTAAVPVPVGVAAGVPVPEIVHDAVLVIVRDAV